MSLATLSQVLQPARASGFAVGAFNASNLEFVQGIVAAAVAERAPVIIQASQGAIRHAGLPFITELIRTAARTVPVPVVMHLDHGRDLDLVRECLRAGFTSVMFDGSALPFEENVRLTAEAVRLARPSGASVEGELGRVPQASKAPTPEEVAALMTDPGEAARFAAETGVDALAVAVGSVHQMGTQDAALDIPRLQAIGARVDLPLVLHGSSGVSEGSLREGVRAGLAKVNFATVLNVAFKRGFLEAAGAEPDLLDPRRYLAHARDAVAEAVRYRIRLLGCSGRA